MSAPVKVGDRVKVTLEGEVAGVAEAGENGTYELRVQVDGQDHFVYTDTARIEKTEEFFGPGDVVRSKDSGTVRVLGRDGWLNLATGRYINAPLNGFTSRFYERVEIA